MALAVAASTLAGCSDDDGEPAPAGSSSSRPVEVTAAFARDADRICTKARDELAALGRDVDFDTTIADPVREALVRPGTEILARQADSFRALTVGEDVPPAVTTYVSYFEIIDALLNARLQVGEPNGPQSSDAQNLEARFQAVAAEQESAAAAAGLPACAFDVTATIFDS